MLTAPPLEILKVNERGARDPAGVAPMNVPSAALGVLSLTQLPQFASQNALGDSAMGDFSQKSSLQSNHLQAAWQSQAQFVE
jgi:hypothetical protein